MLMRRYDRNQDCFPHRFQSSPTNASTTVSDPKRHHYLPEFYQRRWSNNDDLLTVYRRNRSGLEVKHKPPSAIGYGKELYSVRSEQDPKRRQALERVFMGAVDNSAAEALNEMEATGAPPVAPKLRNGWARFIMRLINSSPRRVDYFRAELEQHEKVILREIEESYDKKRGPNDPLTYDEFLRKMDHRSVDRSLALLIQGLVDSPLIGSALVRMEWALLTLPVGTFDLLASDMPVMRSNGLGDKGGFAKMPIGPRKIFLAAHRSDVIRSFATQKPKALVRALNHAVAIQAEHFVIATSETQTPFIDRRLGHGDPSDTKRGAMGDVTWKAPIELEPWG